MLTRLSQRRVLRAVLVSALVISSFVTATAAIPALLPRARADQPVSGAFALGGGVGGGIDPRTGQFSVSVPLVTVASRGDSSVSLTLGWDQARAGIGLDRFGFGGGWGLGATFIQATGKITVYPANGGAYTTDATFHSGLHDYPLQDLVFAFATGTLPARAGVTSPVAYRYTITYDDGRVDYFDPNGNLVARVDRFGNRTDLQYQAFGPGQWRPTAIIDAYGLTTTFSYGANKVTVSAPARSDGVVAQTHIMFDNQHRVTSVTDPAGSVATFLYTPVTGSPFQYLNTVHGPAGAQTIVTYTEVAYPQAQPLFVAKTLQVTDVNRNPLMPTRTFSMNLSTANNFHNYAGNPNHLSTTGDALYDSADPGYRYSTEISNGQSATVSTYDSAHRLVARDVLAAPNTLTPIVVQHQALTYPDFKVPQFQPANYARPLTTAVSYEGSSGPGGVTAISGAPRVVKTSTTYDNHGRVLTSVDETGTTTTNTYDPNYGLVTSTMASGADGTTRSATNTLSADNKTIASTTQAEASAGGKLSARNVVSYLYDSFGQPSQRTIAWAPGAAPPDNGGGPDSSTTKMVSTVDATAVTRTIAVTTAAGTPAAATTTTVFDLVSGQPVKVTDALGRVTTRGYDAAARLVKVTPPTGMTTATTYQSATRTAPATQLVTGPDGHQTQTTYDPLGRVVTVTDNVSKGVFVADPTTRIVSSETYNPNGTTSTATDLAGRATTTTVDPLGRPVSEVSAIGVTHSTTYNDVSNTITRQTIPDGTTMPAQIVGTSYDAKNRELASRTTYPVPGSGRPLFLTDPADQRSYDGIGRTTSVTSADLTAKPDFAGAGGTPVTTTVAPAATAPNPGQPTTATDTTMINARPTLRTLQQPGQPASAGTKVVYDAAGRITSTTDPLGRTTSYTYTLDGQPATSTDPTGTLTTDTYDPSTGQLTTVTAKAAGGATTTTSYTYVPAGSPGAGLVKTLTNESGTVTYGYDADGNRTSIRYPDGSSVTNDYTDTGLLNTSTDVTGAVTTYLYNTDTTLHSASQVRAGVTLASVTYTYDGLGRIATTTRGNGLTTTNTYTPNNLLGTEVTTDAAGHQVETHTYRYDTHHNLTSKTDNTAKPSACAKACPPGPSTFGTWTTSYSYDAYDRLIGSATYSGSNTAGKPITAISYTLDTAGNVSTTTRTTRTTGFHPTTTTTLTTDTIDAAGQLTKRATGMTTTAQTFDANGRVTGSLDGASTSYRPDGLPASVSTSAGATTTFAYWPDGTRRRATTVDPTTGTTSVEFHYAPNGTLANDTTTQASGSATASYLLTTGREARTLDTGTAAPVTTGTGVGYYLRDRHSSVTALVDATGAVTNTYAYGDYGTPALLDGRPGTLLGAAAGTGAGQANPQRYDGASLKALYTDAQLGTMMTPARFYDPSQGRFTARDTANVHNGYVGFATNPIMKVDPTGQNPITDIVIDALYVVAFFAAAIFTGGAAAAAGVAIAGATAATEVTAVTVATLVGDTIATAANGVGLVSNALQLADNVKNATGHGHFLSEDQRNDLNNIATVAGTVAGVAGMLPAAAATFGAPAADAAAEFIGPRLPPGGIPDDPPPVNPNNAAPVDPVQQGEGAPQLNQGPNNGVLPPDDYVPGSPPPNRPPPPIPLNMEPAQPLNLDIALDPEANRNPAQQLNGPALENAPGQPNVNAQAAVPGLQIVAGQSEQLIQQRDPVGVEALNPPPLLQPNINAAGALNESPALTLTNNRTLDPVSDVYEGDLNQFFYGS